MADYTTPLTVTPGAAALASDWNTYVRDNTINLNDRVTDLENAVLAFETAASNTINLNFSDDRMITRAATGNVTFTGSNYTQAKSITVRIQGDGSSRNLSFPADWVFVSFKPTSLAAGKTGILATSCFGSAANQVVAAWAVQS